jgi:hypothetical protein
MVRPGFMLLATRRLIIPVPKVIKLNEVAIAAFKATVK